MVEGLSFSTKKHSSDILLPRSMRDAPPPLSQTRHSQTGGRGGGGPPTFEKFPHVPVFSFGECPWCIFPYWLLMKLDIPSNKVITSFPMQWIKVTIFTAVIIFLFSLGRETNTHVWLEQRWRPPRTICWSFKNLLKQAAAWEVLLAHTWAAHWFSCIQPSFVQCSCYEIAKINTIPMYINIHTSKKRDGKRKKLVSLFLWVSLPAMPASRWHNICEWWMVISYKSWIEFIIHNAQ